MADETSQAGIVASVNVSEVKTAIAEVKAALGEMASAADAAGRALDEINFVSLQAGAVRQVQLLNTELERTIALSAEARIALASMGGGGAAGVAIAGGGGPGGAVGTGGPGAGATKPGIVVDPAASSAPPRYGKSALSEESLAQYNAFAAAIQGGMIPPDVAESSASGALLRRLQLGPRFSDTPWRGSLGKIRAHVMENFPELGMLAAAPLGALGAVGIGPDHLHMLATHAAQSPLAALGALGAAGIAGLGGAFKTPSGGAPDLATATDRAGLLFGSDVAEPMTYKMMRTRLRDELDPLVGTRQARSITSGISNEEVAWMAGNWSAVEQAAPDIVKHGPQFMQMSSEARQASIMGGYVPIQSQWPGMLTQNAVDVQDAKLARENAAVAARARSGASASPLFFGQDAPTLTAGPEKGAVDYAELRKNALADMTSGPVSVSATQARAVLGNLTDDQVQKLSAMEPQFRAAAPDLRAAGSQLGSLTHDELFSAIGSGTISGKLQDRSVMNEARSAAAQTKLASLNTGAIAQPSVASMLRRGALESRTYDPATDAVDPAALSWLTDNKRYAAAMSNTDLGRIIDGENPDDVIASSPGANSLREQDMLKAEEAAARDVSGATKKGLAGHLVNRHSPMGGFMYGLTMMPAFAAAGIVTGAVTSGFVDMAQMQDASANAALAQNVPINSDTIEAERNAMGSLGAPLGIKPADMMQTFTESFRLTHDVPKAEQLTRSVAILGKITGNDPATTQQEIAPVYKSFGEAGANRLPDLLAAGTRIFDTSPAQLEQAIAKSAPIIGSVGMGTPGGKQDLEALVAMAGTLMQNADLSPATAQSALRLFSGNLRSLSKAKTLKKAGFTDFTSADTGETTTADDLSVIQALSEISNAYEGDPAKGRAPDHNKGMEMLQSLAGGRSGFQMSTLIQYADELGRAFKELTGTVQGTGAAYATTVTDRTLSGQMSQLSADWAKLWSNPNSAPAKAASGTVNFLDSAINSVNDSGTLASAYGALGGDPSLSKYADPRLRYALPGMVGAEAILDSGTVGSSITSMQDALIKQLIDPKTPDGDRQRLLKELNTEQAILGHGPFNLEVTGGGPAKISAAASGTAANVTAAPVPTSAFAQAVSKGTGIPAGVMQAWQYQEGATDPSAHNPLNIMPIGGGPPLHFKDDAAGAQATIDFLTKNDKAGYYKHILDLAKGGASPEQIIAAIGQSPFDAGHYSHGGKNGPAGSDLQKTYQTRVAAPQTSASNAPAGSQWWQHGLSGTAASGGGDRLAGYEWKGPTDYGFKPVHDTDIQDKAGTPVTLGFSGTFLGGDNKHGQGREEAFAIDGGGNAMALHLRSMGNLKVGQHYDAGTVIGTSGGVPGVDVPNRALSSGEHLCWVTDEQGHEKLIDLMTGKEVPHLVGTPQAAAAPHIDAAAQRKSDIAHMTAISGHGNTALHTYRGASADKINPYAGLAIVRAEQAYGASPQDIDALFSDIDASLHAPGMTDAKRGALRGFDPASARALIQREVQKFNPADGVQGHMSDTQMGHVIDAGVQAMKTWGAFDAHTLPSQATPAAQNTASAATLPPADQRSADIAHLSQISGNAKTALHAYRGASADHINPYAGMAIVRAEQAYNAPPQDIDQMFADINASLHADGMTDAKRNAMKGFDPASARALIQREVQKFNPAEDAPGHMSDTQMNRVIDTAVVAMKTWGAFGTPMSYGLVGAPAGSPGGQIISGPQGAANQAAADNPGSTTNTLLQQMVDNTAAANGYLNRMAQFNVPAGYGNPFWEGWAAHTGATPSPHKGRPPIASAKSGGVRQVNRHSVVH